MRPSHLLAMGMILSAPTFAIAISASATTFVVRPDGTGDFANLEAALLAVTNGDRIELADGTFSGAGNRDVDFLGKAVTIASQSGDPTVCIIDCGGSESEPHRGFVFQSGEGSGSVLDGIAVRGGYLSGGDNNAGGAIYCTDASSPTLRNCRFESCSATYGGAVAALNSSSPNISGCEFVANQATDGGGAIYLYFSASPAITDCIFRENHADRGGAASLQFQTSPAFAECDFFDNTSTRDGAGVYCSSNASPTIAGCVFASNVATLRGGALYCSGSTAEVRNCTLFANGGSQGGGILCNVASAVTIENTIIAFGAGESVLCLVDGTATLSCSDLFGNTGGDWVGSIAGQLNTAGNLSADPKFCDSGLKDFGLFPESPCAPSEPCGLIGALPVTCGAPATVITSWGAVKHDFR